MSQVPRHLGNSQGRTTDIQVPYEARPDRDGPVKLYLTHRSLGAIPPMLVPKHD